MTNKQVRKIILESGSHSSSPDTVTGYGLLSAYTALTFPNIKTEMGNFIINKMMIDTNGVNSQSVQIHYRKLGEGITDEFMSNAGASVYSFSLPQYLSRDTIEFYFTYTDTLGNNQRVPQGNTYKMIYGKDYISLNTTLKDEFIPKVYFVSQNYPNPFNSYTRINYELPVPGGVNIRIYDILGREVATIVNGYQDEGSHTVIFNPKNLASGVYIYRIQVNDYIADQKMLYLK